MKIGLRAFAVIAAALVMPAACSSTRPEALGTTAERLGADVNIGIGSETSVAVGPLAGGGQAVVVGWNETNHATGFPDRVAQWSVSTNGGGAWSFRSEINNPWVATTAQRPLMSDGSRYQSTSSDPAVAATGWPGMFVYVTTATSQKSFAKPGHPSMDIVMGTSMDGGLNFGPAAGNGGRLQVLSDSASSGHAGASREVDRPVVYAEDPRTHVIWVAWANPDSHGCGTQNWLRRIHFHADGTFDLGLISEIRIDCNLNCVWFDASNIAASCDAPHAGLDDCGGGSGGGLETVLIAFPRVNNGITGSCWLGGNTMLFVNQTSCVGQDLDIQWKVAISQNPATVTPTHWKQGVTGADGSSQMNEDLHWPQCAVPSAWNVNNRARPVTIHDDITNQWHVYYTMETFNGVPPNTKSGLRVFHDQFNDNFTSLPFDFEETNPVLILPGAPGPCDTGGGGHECLVDQFMPSGTWSPITAIASTHVVAWYDTRRNPTTPKGAFWSATSKTNGNIGTFSISGELDQAGLLAPWSFTGNNGNTAWGDYNGMASDRAGTFFPAWGDNRNGGVETQVFARPFQP